MLARPGGRARGHTYTWFVAYVDVEDVVVEYPGEVLALDGVDLHIMDGEFLAVLGPSGSGKTTLVRVIAGLEKAEAGVIRIDGREVTTTAAHRRNVSMVFQDGALYPHLTAERNMGFPLRLRKRTDEEIDRRVGEVAASLTLTQYLQRKPSDLSAGHRHGVATGRAILGAGRLLLMDEPLANLDSRMRQRVRGELRERTAAEEATILYATNDQEEAMMLADRIAILEAGRIRQVGTPQQIYQTPASMFVAGFVGNPPMNIIDAVVAEDGGGVELSLAGRTIHVGADVVDTSPRLREFAGREVYVGVRPEHLRFGGAGDVGTEQRVGGEVVQVEFLGGEQLVHFLVEGATTFTVRLPMEAAVQVGSHVALGIEPERLHFFDPDDGLAI